MLALLTCVAELVVSAIESADSIQNIRASMRVDAVHDHHDAVPVRLINHILHIVRSSRPGRDGKEVRHVVAKGSIVAVLLDCHKLNAVVSHVLDSWKHIVCKLTIA